MRLTEVGGQIRMATTNPTMNPAGKSADIRSIQSMPQDGPSKATFGHMKWIPLALGLTVALATGCSKTTVRSTQLAQGAALLAIEPVKAHVVVDTTTTLQAVSQTKVVLGIFRSGDREFAEYPGMIFQRGPGTRERKAASVGSSLGMNAEIDHLAASFSGARGELSPDELGATLTPVSSAAASMVVSLGATYRFGPLQTGLLWSSQSLAGGSQRNNWIAAGAEDIQAIRMMRLRLGMTF